MATSKPLEALTPVSPRPLVEKDKRSDIAIVVEDKELYIPRLILTYTSPVFEAMLEGDFKEKDTSRIELPGKKYNDVLHYMRCVHPRILDDVTEENVLTVLSLAVEYQHCCLVDKCERFMIQTLQQLPGYSGTFSEHKHLEKTFTYMMMAEKFNLKKLMSAALTSNTLKTCKSSVFQRNEIFKTLLIETRNWIFMERLKYLND